MNRNDGLEAFGTTVNDSDPHLPKSRGRCFDIGTWGGCGVTCAAFLDGECGEPQEIDKQDIIDEHGEEDAQEIFKLYDCFERLTVRVYGDLEMTNEEIREEILKDWYGNNKYRELELGEKIVEGDMYLFENSIMRKATDTGNGVYTSHHWPHYRLDI